jgi:hypothetical protein
MTAGAVGMLAGGVDDGGTLFVVPAELGVAPHPTRNVRLAIAATAMLLIITVLPFMHPPAEYLLNSCCGSLLRGKAAWSIDGV